MTECDRIHPTALISPEAEIASDVRIGAFTIIEGRVKIGAGTVIHPRCHLMGPLTLGENNQVYSGAMLGGYPQHLRFQGEETSTEIGNGNIIRENVTIHRATTDKWVTRVGDGNFIMVNVHIGHDCQIANRCILVNNCLVAGHCELADGAYISGNSAIHQFNRMGRLSFLSGVSASTKDIPPFIMQQNINQVVGVNIIGMRRAGMASADINAIRKLYHLFYRSGDTVPVALAKIEAELGRHAAVQEFVEFVRTAKKGVNGVMDAATAMREAA